MSLKNKISGLLSSKLATQSITYTFFNVLSRSVPFLLIPFLTTHLSTEDYGLITMFLVVVGAVSSIVGVNTVSAIDRSYFNDKITKFNEYIGNCFLILAVSTIVALVLFFFFESWLVKYTKIPVSYLYLAVLVAAFQFLVKTLLSVWRVTYQAVSYGVYQVLLSITDLSLTVGLIYFYNQAWEGRVLGSLISYLIFGLIAFFILLKKYDVSFKVNKDYIRNALVFGVPLIPHVLGRLAMTMTDRIFISNMVGLDATGIYALAYQIGTILLIIVTSFNTAYVPWLYSSLSKNEKGIKDKIVKLTYSYFGVLAIITLLMIIGATFFLEYLVGEEFLGSKEYLVWAFMGFAFNGMYLMVTNFIFYSQKTQYLAIITFSSIFINLPLNYFLILKNGALGAAQATTILNFLLFCATWYLSSRVYNMPWFSILSNEKV